MCDSSKTNIPKTTILSDEPKHFLYKRLSYLPHILGQTCHLQFSGNFSSPLLLQFLSHVKSVKSAKLGESLKLIYLTFQLSTGYLEWHVKLLDQNFGRYVKSAKFRESRLGCNRVQWSKIGHKYVKITNTSKIQNTSPVLLKFFRHFSGTICNV